MILHSFLYGYHAFWEKQKADHTEIVWKSSSHGAVSSVLHRYRTAPVWLPCGDRTVAVR